MSEPMTDAERVREFVDTYEWRDDDGGTSRSLDENDRALLEDFAHGLIAHLRLDRAEAAGALRPEPEWYEDLGPVLWWRYPVEEAPWVGTPLDSNWIDGYYTHWTPLHPLPAPPRAGDGEA